MTALRDVSYGVPEPVEPDDGFTALIDDKAWQHLGVTGTEFRRQWYAGLYRDDPRSEVQALNRLMSSGHWLVIDDTEADV